MSVGLPTGAAGHQPVCWLARGVPPNLSHATHFGRVTEIGLSNLVLSAAVER
jgi:hypothetical protein